jgi:hypothetical protein
VNLTSTAIVGNGTKEPHQSSDRDSKPRALRCAAVTPMNFTLQVEVGPRDVYNTGASGASRTFAPRIFPSMYECDWVASCVRSLRLQGASNTGKRLRVYSLACDCCWSPQRSRRSYGAFRTSKLSPDSPESIVSTNQRLKCTRLDLTNEFGIAPTRWRLRETQAVWIC